MSECATFFGKYRGKVENNLDPSGLGRMKISCPAVLGEGTDSWAMPCTPFAGKGVGLFFLPPKGANVWVEFEGGDPDYPIWSGCFWGDGEVPAAPAQEEMKVIKTDGITLTLSDAKGSGGLTLEVKLSSGTLKLVMDSKGIELSNGSQKIALTTASVSVNDGALEVV